MFRALLVCLLLLPQFLCQTGVECSPEVASFSDIHLNEADVESESRPMRATRIQKYEAPDINLLNTSEIPFEILQVYPSPNGENVLIGRYQSLTIQFSKPVVSLGHRGDESSWPVRVKLINFPDSLPFPIIRGFWPNTSSFRLDCEGGWSENVTLELTIVEQLKSVDGDFLQKILNEPYSDELVTWKFKTPEIRVSISTISSKIHRQCTNETDSYISKVPSSSLELFQKFSSLPDDAEIQIQFSSEVFSSKILASDVFFLVPVESFEHSSVNPGNFTSRKELSNKSMYSISRLSAKTCTEDKNETKESIQCLILSLIDPLDRNLIYKLVFNFVGILGPNIGILDRTNLAVLNSQIHKDNLFVGLRPPMIYFEQKNFNLTSDRLGFAIPGGFQKNDLETLKLALKKSIVISPKINFSVDEVSTEGFIIYIENFSADGKYELQFYETPAVKDCFLEIIQSSKVSLSASEFSDFLLLPSRYDSVSEKAVTLRPGRHPATYFPLIYRTSIHSWIKIFPIRDVNFSALRTGEVLLSEYLGKEFLLPQEPHASYTLDLSSEVVSENIPLPNYWTSVVEVHHGETVTSILNSHPDVVTDVFVVCEREVSKLFFNLYDNIELQPVEGLLEIKLWQDGKIVAMTTADQNGDAKIEIPRIRYESTITITGKNGNTSISNIPSCGYYYNPGTSKKQFAISTDLTVLAPGEKYVVYGWASQIENEPFALTEEIILMDYPLAIEYAIMLEVGHTTEEGRLCNFYVLDSLSNSSSFFFKELEVPIQSMEDTQIQFSSSLIVFESPGSKNEFLEFIREKKDSKCGVVSKLIKSFDPSLATSFVDLLTLFDRSPTILSPRPPSVVMTSEPSFLGTFKRASNISAFCYVETYEGAPLSTEVTASFIIRSTCDPPHSVYYSPYMERIWTIENEEKINLSDSLFSIKKGTFVSGGIWYGRRSHNIEGEILLQTDPLSGDTEFSINIGELDKLSEYIKDILDGEFTNCGVHLVDDNQNIQFRWKSFGLGGTQVSTFQTADIHDLDFHSSLLINGQKDLWNSNVLIGKIFETKITVNYFKDTDTWNPIEGQILLIQPIENKQPMLDCKNLKESLESYYSDKNLAENYRILESCNFNFTEESKEGLCHFMASKEFDNILVVSAILDSNQHFTSVTCSSIEIVPAVLPAFEPQNLYPSLLPNDPQTVSILNPSTFYTEDCLTRNTRILMNSFYESKIDHSLIEIPGCFPNESKDITKVPYEIARLSYSLSSPPLKGEILSLRAFGNFRSSDDSKRYSVAGFGSIMVPENKDDQQDDEVIQKLSIKVLKDGNTVTETDPSSSISIVVDHSLSGQKGDLIIQVLNKEWIDVDKNSMRNSFYRNQGKYSQRKFVKSFSSIIDTWQLEDIIAAFRCHFKAAKTHPYFLPYFSISQTLPGNCIFKIPIQYLSPQNPVYHFRDFQHMKAFHGTMARQPAPMEQSDAGAPPSEEFNPAIEETKKTRPRSKIPKRIAVKILEARSNDGISAFEVSLPESTGTVEIRAYFTQTKNPKLAVSSGSIELQITKDAEVKSIMPSFLRIGDSIDLDTFITVKEIPNYDLSVSVNPVESDMIKFMIDEIKFRPQSFVSFATFKAKVPMQIGMTPDIFWMLKSPSGLKLDVFKSAPVRVLPQSTFLQKSSLGVLYDAGVETKWNHYIEAINVIGGDHVDGLIEITTSFGVDRIYQEFVRDVLYENFFDIDPFNKVWPFPLKDFNSISDFPHFSIIVAILKLQINEANTELQYDLNRILHVTIKSLLPQYLDKELGVLTWPKKKDQYHHLSVLLSNNCRMLEGLEAIRSNPIIENEEDIVGMIDLITNITITEINRKALNSTGGLLVEKDDWSWLVKVYGTGLEKLDGLLSESVRLLDVKLYLEAIDNKCVLVAHALRVSLLYEQDRRLHSLRESCLSLLGHNIAIQSHTAYFTFPGLARNPISIESQILGAELMLGSAAGKQPNHVLLSFQVLSFALTGQPSPRIVSVPPFAIDCVISLLTQLEDTTSTDNPKMEVQVYVKKDDFMSRLKIGTLTKQDHTMKTTIASPNMKKAPDSIHIFYSSVVSSLALTSIRLAYVSLSSSIPHSFDGFALSREICHYSRQKGCFDCQNDQLPIRLDHNSLICHKLEIDSYDYAVDVIVSSLLPSCFEFPFSTEDYPETRFSQCKKYRNFKSGIMEHHCASLSPGKSVLTEIMVASFKGNFSLPMVSIHSKVSPGFTANSAVRPNAIIVQ
eukprot:GHVP01033017.1.p1 GENE.GHVP01033017.1~~GHVP01033017.1.p1  ORF type:complete len:2234 (+),score=402.32 GHVP01033017.1:2034-8735(+)